MAINTSIGASLLKFQFTDENDEVVASFRMNPADVKLAKRMQEASQYFDKIGDQIPEKATIDDVIKLNDEIENKVCEVLGYDAKNSLFGFISATSIMADGNMFVVHVMSKIKDHVAPEIEKRNNAMAAAVGKHTDKYTK